MVGYLYELQHPVGATLSGILSERHLGARVLAAARPLQVPGEAPAHAVPLGANDLAVGVLDVRLGHQQLVRRGDVGLVHCLFQGLGVVSIDGCAQGQQRAILDGLSTCAGSATTGLASARRQPLRSTPAPGRRKIWSKGPMTSEMRSSAPKDAQQPSLSLLKYHSSGDSGCNSLKALL
eukprot:CAMPEP_0179117688 /NCGR_PEP_ID=MMETSP0796-20121207/55294_1 /TAXON_ID=73915 /ORGANISM="Pyrodinium bahamense, Strain pbaha01" /LENGTH=177 /DNA_ID=CAMNT_0020816077 /DNA_START=103 /DNA_END=636 /DNA_ORIENTATION=-